MSDHILRQAERDFALGDIDVARLNVIRIRHGIEPMITAEEIASLKVIRHYCQLEEACPLFGQEFDYASYVPHEDLPFDWVTTPENRYEPGKAMQVGEMRNDWCPEDMEMRLECLEKYGQNEHIPWR